MTSPATPPSPTFKIQVRCQTPEQLFQDIASQLFAQLIDPREVGETLREKAVVEGESMEELIQAWIVVLLDFLRKQKMVFSAIRVLRINTPKEGTYSLQAEATGELLDPHRHPLLRDPTWLKCRHISLRWDPTGYHVVIELA